jgi:hypothetical protein
LDHISKVIVYDFSLPAEASPLKLTYENRVYALDEPLPNGSEESAILFGWMLPVELIELDWVVNR